MLTVVTFCFNGSRPIYGREHVENLRNQFARHLTLPHEFRCVSDDPSVPGYFPIWPAPEGVHGWNHDPKTGTGLANFVRLGVFGAPGRELGRQLLVVDLDTILRANIDDLIPAEPVRTMKGFQWLGQKHLQGGFFLCRAGCRPELWADAHDQAAINKAWEMGFRGSDQALMSMHFFNSVPVWTEADGIVINKTEIVPNWRVYLAAAWPKPWQPESPVRDEYYQQSSPIDSSPIGSSPRTTRGSSDRKQRDSARNHI